MPINLGKLSIVFTNFRDRLSGFEVVFEGLKSFCIDLVSFEIHVFSQDYIFGNLSFDFVKISIVEEPVFRKEDFIR